MSIRDDIDKLGASSSDTAKGQCAKCGDENPYSSIVCSGCGARLPWADAVSDKARATASTHAPLSIASARATVNPPSGSSGGGSGSGGSRGPIGPAIATVLLIVGGLIGAAVVVPNFVSRSETVQPTPAGLAAPRSAQPMPSSAPVYQAPPVQAPQVAPPAPPPVERSRRAAARAPQAPRQTPSVDAVDNIPQMVADISADIRSAPSQQEADAHAFACQGMIEKLNEKMRSDPGNADLYGQWSKTMGHLESAAMYKSASFDDPGGATGETKLATMGAMLNAAQGAATTTQQMIEERRNPALARQRREEFRKRLDSYENFYRQQQ